jgi:hypothetical protein
MPIFVVSLSTALLGWHTATAQIPDPTRNYVGLADSTIQRVFGQPNGIAQFDEKDAVVWTYLLPPPPAGTASGVGKADSAGHRLAAFSLLPHSGKQNASGYWQLAFWNGRVSAFSLLQIGPQADSTYDTVIGYLEAEANWLGRGANSPHSRLTRIGDSVWIVDKVTSGPAAEAVVRVGDAGYMVCSKSRPAELSRVKAEFGVTLH